MDPKTPPHSEESEKLLIGQILRRSEYYLNIQDRLRPEDFYSTKWQKVFAEYREMHNRDGKVEWVDLLDRCRKHGMTGPELSALIDEAEPYQHTDYALRKVIDCSHRRNIHDFLIQVEMDLHRSEDVNTIYNDLAVFGSTQRREQGKVYEPGEYAILGTEENALPLIGYETGFPRLDRHIKGLVPRRLTIVSGPTGEGKTTLAINWLAKACITSSDPVPGLFASLEMDHRAVTNRLLGVISGEFLDSIENGRRKEDVAFARDRIKAGKLLLSDNWPRDINDVAAMMERYSISHGIKIFVLDYIGEMVRDNTKQKEDRDERFSRWIKKVRDIAKKRDLHAVVLAQVNQEEHLAESKKMGHLADTVLFFKREGNEYFLNCRKNRFGPKGHRYQIQFNTLNQRMTETAMSDEPETRVHDD